MQITGITVSRALTALTFTPLADKSPSVTLVHPGSGPGAIVTFFDTSTGAQVGSVSVGPSRPVKTSLIGCGTSLTLSYQVDVQDSGTIPSPGLTINLSTSAEEDEIIGAIFDGTTVSADGTQIILPKPLSSSSTAKTAPLATILATVPAVGTVAQPTDYPDGRLVVVGTKWGGYVGMFPDLATLNAVTKTNIAAGAKASVVGIGEYELIGGAWVAQLTRNSIGTLSTNGVALVVQEEYFATTTARDTAYPSGGFLGQICWMPNTNVPLGRSRLRWNGTIWAPPAGENIICLFGAAGAAVAQVTPGVLTLSQVYKSALIPDYMIPDGIAFGYHWEHSTKNASGVANSIAYVELSGATPTATDGGTALVGQSLNPSSSNWTNDQPHHGQRVGTQFAHAWGLFSQGSGAGQTTQRSSVSGAFVSNGTYLYVMAKPTHVSDQENFISFRMWSVGNQ